MGPWLSSIVIYYGAISSEIFGLLHYTTAIVLDADANLMGFSISGFERKVVGVWKLHLD